MKQDHPLHGPPAVVRRNSISTRPPAPVYRLPMASENGAVPRGQPRNRSTLNETEEPPPYSDGTPTNTPARSSTPIFLPTPRPRPTDSQVRHVRN